jgi:hypothetical protein
MGGRGTESSLVNQINLQDIIDRQEIDKIMNHVESIRQGNAYEGNLIEESKFRECVCCENRTIPINSVNHRCSVCGWIDDEHQNNNPDSLDGPNNISLRKAKQIWRKGKMMG